MIENEIIRVKINHLDFLKYTSDAETQFGFRMQLREAGIPLGPWGTSTVTKGTLTWWDIDLYRIVEWKP